MAKTTDLTVRVRIDRRDRAALEKLLAEVAYHVRGLREALINYAATDAPPEAPDDHQ